MQRDSQSKSAFSIPLCTNKQCANCYETLTLDLHYLFLESNIFMRIQMATSEVLVNESIFTAVFWSLWEYEEWGYSGSILFSNLWRSASLNLINHRDQGTQRKFSHLHVNCYIYIYIYIYIIFCKTKTS